MLLAFDDTDGPDGGCTTFLAGAVLEALGPEHATDHPRLVRLDPDHPWKTRGNAAVVLELSDDLTAEAALETAFSVVREHARVAEGKGAGVAVFEEPPDPSWYERGVQGPVPLEEARRTLEDRPTRTLGTGRGLVGALCAAAWRPDRSPSTYTRIAYREPERWGTPRQVDPSSVRAVEERYESTFDCYDEHADHPVMVPRTPCPVLYGLRATRPDRLDEAQREIASEPVSCATTFATNQASDDHIAPEDLAILEVTDPPRALEGGHVAIEAEGERGPVTCMAFEPTGRLRAAVRAVEVGDRILPVGSWTDGQVNLEKLLHRPARKRATQACPSCGRSMASAGRGGPVRCRRCGHREPKRFEQGPVRWTEADASARRHLARPLELGLADHVYEAARPLVDETDGSARTAPETA